MNEVTVQPKPDYSQYCGLIKAPPEGYRPNFFLNSPTTGEKTLDLPEGYFILENILNYRYTNSHLSSRKMKERAFFIQGVWDMEKNRKYSYLFQCGTNDTIVGIFSK